MSTPTISRGTNPPDTWADTQLSPRKSLMRRIFGVVARPQSYRNIAYLLLGLPLGTIWFSVLVTGYAVGISMIVVALVGIPMLWAMWHVVRTSANVERGTANVLLGQHLAPAPPASTDRGNLWVRLQSMSKDRVRRRELGYLMLRFPVGIATFTAVVTALAVPVIVAYAPFSARYGSEHAFGEWSGSSRIEDLASSSPWSWFLVPLGALLLIVAFHLLNALARACGRWTAASLDG